MKAGSRGSSIYILLLRLLIISAVVSVLAYVLMNHAGQYALDWYYSNSDYLDQRNDRYIKKLEGYIKKHHLESDDAKKLNTWVRSQKIISIQIYKDNTLTYDSDYPNQNDISMKGTSVDYHNWATYYTLEFKDGPADVLITGKYAYQFYTYARTLELLLSFILFLLLVVLGIRRKMAYIHKLNKEVEILEGGNLDYEITVTGKDELAALARGLNCMRLFFLEQAEQEAKITQENQRIITEMSHDLRTPLTSVMLYTEILKKGSYKDEKQLKEYIDKIDRKTHLMKQLSDHLFEYSLVTGDTQIELEEPEAFEVLFYDLFSETCSYLEQRGFVVLLEMEWLNRRLCVYTDYIIRIMDNITSNIVKYADTEQPVKISSVYTKNMAGFSFENVVKSLDEKEESTCIGIQSIKNMMAKMNGECVTEQREGLFKISLSFPCHGI